MPIHEAQTGMRAKLTVQRVLTEICLMLLMAAILAATGPFGTFFHGSFPVRLAYWLRTALAAYVLYRPGITLFATLACRLGFSEASGWIAAVVVWSAPMTLYLWHFGPTIMLDRPWPNIEQFMETYWQVISLGGIAMFLLWWRAAPEDRQAPAPVPEQVVPEQVPANLSVEAPAAIPAAAEAAEPAKPDAGPAPRLGPLLSERLPPHLGDDVIALQMEDHYVRVHTTLGDTLILLRMADAVADLAQVDGLRVHRSWWAARHAVVAVDRQGRSATLTLTNGLTVPVARDRLPQLRERGWLGA